MTKEEYKKLNSYYNDLCLGLSVDDDFFLNNIHSFGSLSTEILMIFENVNLKDEKQDDCFTFLEVYDKAREVLKDIDSKYLEDYDTIVDDGTLNANYEISDIPYLQRRTNNSIYYPKTNSIEINSSFNYDMIAILIHEYFHKTNFSNNKARYLLTEFISIYFELYTYEYFKKQGIDSNNFELQNRLKELEKNADFLSSNTYFVYYFENFGNLDENSYKNMEDITITKEQYEECLCDDLIKFEKLEKDYYEKYKTRYENFSIYLANCYNDDYRYFICTILAYYALYNISKDNVLRLNEALIKDKNITIDEAFKILNINLNKKDFDIELGKALVRYIKENNLIKEETIVNRM